jgi:hypothetical protein
MDLMDIFLVQLHKRGTFFKLKETLREAQWEHKIEKFWESKGVRPGL